MMAFVVSLLLGCNSIVPNAILIRPGMLTMIKYSCLQSSTKILTKSFVIAPRSLSKSIRYICRHSRSQKHGGLCAAGLVRLKLHQSVQSTRSCFHPGASAQVPAEGLSATEVTGRVIVRKILELIWPAGNWQLKRRVVGAMTLLVAAKVANVYVPFVFKHLIDGFNAATGGHLQMTDAGSTILTAAAMTIIAYGLVRASSSLCNELRNAVFAKVAQNSLRSISRQVFLHLHSLDLSFHLSRQTGALAKAIDRGTRGMSFALSALVFNVVPTAVEVSFVTGIMYYSGGPWFAAATVATIGAYSSFTIGITRWRTKFRHEMNAADNEAGNRAVDSLINYETVKYFNNEKYEADRYDFLLKDYERASLKTATSLAFLNFGQNAIVNTGLIAVMCLAAQGIANGTMTVGDLVLVNGLVLQLSMPLNFLGSVYREVRQGLIDMQTMFSLLEIRSSIRDSVTAANLTVLPENATIQFKDVWFEYPGTGQPILKGLTFSVPAGKKVAVVGGSGSGKSTIIRLLVRFYDPQQGTISVGGRDIREVTQFSLREAVGVVPQDCVLFHDTLLHNIQYGRVEAGLEEVYGASRMADLHDAVERMPHQYATVVGERGLKLSGGEKQRVAIARAILKNPPIIVYDEATSSLDSITEQNIMSALKRATSQRTSFYIAHRLATIRDSDEILVLEDGRVVEQGSHDHLLGNPGSRYAKLWKSQNASPEIHKAKAAKPDGDAAKELEKLLAGFEGKTCCKTRF